jgi:hypothetical protein
MFMRLLFLLMFVPFVSEADLVLRYKAYVAQRGFSPDIVNTRGSPITVFVNPDKSLDRISWNSWKAGLGEPLVTDIPDASTASNILTQYYANQEAERQATKPLEQRQYENQFFALTEQLFNLTGVTNDVTPKLGFPELQAKIEQVQATDPMLAVNLSLKLLSIDSALKRYDTLWWDDAIQHVLGE